jgi:vitamin B12 transporter
MRARQLAATAAPMALAAAGAFAQNTVELPEIVVLSPNRTETEAARVGSSVTVVERADIERDGDVNALDALRRTPGLSVVQSGGPGAASTVRLRGLGAENIQVRVDGIDIADPAGPVITPNLGYLKTGEIGRIEVLRGSQGALYGGHGVAGVIDITTRRAEQPGLSHSLDVEGGSYATAYGAYSLAGGFDRGEFALNAVGFRTDGFSAADEDDGNTEEDGSSNVTLSGFGEIALGDGFSLGGAARYTDARVDNDSGFPIADDPDLRQEAVTWGGRAFLRSVALEDRLENEVSIQYFSSDRDEIDGDSVDSFDGDRVKAEYLGLYSLSESVAFQFGGDWTRESFDTRSAFAADSGDASIWGGFAQVTLDPTETITITGALRHDEHSEFGGFTTGRATAAWRPIDGTKLRASVSNGFRTPSLFELYSGSFGNPDLDPEKSFSWEVGVDQAFDSGRGLLSATYFAIDTDDKIGFDPNTFQTTQIPGVTESRGVEIALSWAPVDWISLGATYAYVDSRDETGAREVRVPRHQAGFSIAAQPVERLSVGVNGTIVADLNDSPFAPDPDFDEDYFLLGAQIAYDVHQNAALYVRAENVLDQDYQTVSGYGTSDFAVYAGVRARW